MAKISIKIPKGTKLTTKSSQPAMANLKMAAIRSGPTPPKSKAKGKMPTVKETPITSNVDIIKKSKKRFGL